MRGHARSYIRLDHTLARPRRHLIKNHVFLSAEINKRAICLPRAKSYHGSNFPARQGPEVLALGGGKSGENQKIPMLPSPQGSNHHNSAENIHNVCKHMDFDAPPQASGEDTAANQSRRQRQNRRLIIRRLIKHPQASSGHAVSNSLTATCMGKQFDNSFSGSTCMLEPVVHIAVRTHGNGEAHLQ